MPIQRESRAAQGRTAACAISARRFTITRAPFQQRRFVRQDWLRGAVADKLVARFQARARRTGTSTRTFSATLATALCKRAIRPLVCEASGREIAARCPDAAARRPYPRPRDSLGRYV